MLNSKENKVLQIILHIIFILLSICAIVPFLLLISISLSNEIDIGLYGYKMIPLHFDLTAYEYIFKNPTQILDAYKITIITTIFGTALSVFLMCLIAYPLSRKNFNGKKFISFYLFFTMLFSGGMVPSYILNTRYFHLGDTIWIYIIPGLINVWQVFLIRTFFQKLPYEIVEAARIDGAGEYRILFEFIVPISKPVLATVALFGVLARWNDYTTAMIYINNDSLVTLQYLLHKIMSNLQMIQMNSEVMDSLGISAANIPSETIRMAMAVVAAGPMMFVFPFFQKYFIKGLTVGSVKG